MQLKGEKQAGSEITNPPLRTDCILLDRSSPTPTNILLWIFSNRQNSLKMCMVNCLLYMLCHILIPSSLHSSILFSDAYKEAAEFMLPLNISVWLSLTRVQYLFWGVFFRFILHAMINIDLKCIIYYILTNAYRHVIYTSNKRWKAHFQHLRKFPLSRSNWYCGFFHHWLGFTCSRISYK